MDQGVIYAFTVTYCYVLCSMAVRKLISTSERKAPKSTVSYDHVEKGLERYLKQDFH